MRTREERRKRSRETESRALTLAPNRTRRVTVSRSPWPAARIRGDTEFFLEENEERTTERDEKRASEGQRTKEELRKARRKARREEKGREQHLPCLAH
jgi:hypothetical protein